MKEKEYDIKITETLEMTVTVNASSREEAERKVERAWKNAEYVLDGDNFTGVEFVTQQERLLEQEKMNVLLVESGQYPRVFQVGTELEDLQKAVAGNIEVTYPFDDEVGVILNEEGKLNGMPLNRAIRTEEGEVYDIYAGPFLVVGLTEDSFCSLTPEQMKKYGDMFHQPEMFVRMGRSLMVLPIPDESIKPRETTKDFKLKMKKEPEHADL